MNTNTVRMCRSENRHRETSYPIRTEFKVVTAYSSCELFSLHGTGIGTGTGNKMDT